MTVILLLMTKMIPVFVRVQVQRYHFFIHSESGLIKGQCINQASVVSSFLILRLAVKHSQTNEINRFVVYSSFKIALSD